MHSKFLVSISIFFLAYCSEFSLLKAQPVSREYSSYLKGKELFDKGLYSASRVALENHLLNYPDAATTSEASYYRAVSAVRLSQEDGEMLIQDYVDQYPEGSHASSAFLELSEYYYENGSFKKAISFYEKSSGYVTEEIWFKMGVAYFSEKEYHNALKLLSHINVDSDLVQDAAYFQGVIFNINGDKEEALTSLEKAFDSEEFGKEAVKTYAILLYEQNEYQKVVEVIETRMLGSTDPVLLKLLGDANYELAEYRLASLNYKEFLRKNKRTDAASYFKIGQCFTKLDDKAGAIQNLKKAALSKDTIGAYASYYLGKLYIEEDNLIFASTAFKNASKYDIDLKEEALYAYGKTEFDQKNYQSTIKIYTGFNDEFKGSNRSTQVNEMLTQSYLNNNDHQAAISYIENLSFHSEKIKGIYQSITYLRGTEYFNAKKFKNAIVNFKKSLKYQQDAQLSRDANFWIGESYSYEKKYDKAIPYYQSSIGLGSNLSKYSLAYAHYNKKDYSSAKSGFLSFTRSYIDKRYLADAFTRLGDCFYAEKDYDQALSYYKKSENEGSKDLPYNYYQSGVVNRYKGDSKSAIASFEKLIEKYPKSGKVDDASFQIAQITYENSNYENAVKKYQAYIRKYPDSNFIPYALLNQAVSYHNLNRYSKSSENYQIILDRFPRHQTANSALLGLQELASMGEFNDFSAYLNKYKKANPDSEALENIEFETAKSMYYNLQYDQAIASFKQFLTNYPSTELSTDANYFMADSYYRKSELDDALKGFYNIVEYVDYSKHNKILYRIATIESRKANHTNAIAFYNNLKNSANTSKEKVNAKKGLMESYFAISNYDSASFYAKDLIDNHRISNEIESTATLTAGLSAYHTDRLDDAFDWLLPLLGGVNDEKGAQAKYYISRILYDKGDHAQSLKSLFELTETYASFDLWMGKAFLLMSDNYLATDELFQAEATLNSLIENSPLVEIKEEAKKKLKTIKEAEKEELVVLSDTVDANTDTKPVEDEK